MAFSLVNVVTLVLIPFLPFKAFWPLSSVWTLSLSLLPRTFLSHPALLRCDFPLFMPPHWSFCARGLCEAIRPFWAPNSQPRWTLVLWAGLSSARATSAFSLPRLTSSSFTGLDLNGSGGLWSFLWNAFLEGKGVCSWFSAQESLASVASTP